MSNPAAVIALTYAGTDVQQNPIGIFLEIARGLNEVAEVRGSDTVVPGLAGRVSRNRVADRRTIELRGLVAGSGATEAAQRSSFRTLVNTVRTLFSPTAAPANLVATLENGTTGTIAARTLPTLLWDQLGPSVARVSIELESVAPDWTVT